MARFDSGWVKNYRLRYDHWLETDLLARAVLDTLVRWAYYEDSPSNAKLQVKRGQCVTSSLELSKKFKIGRKRIRRVLDELQARLVIGQLKGHRGTIVTILNYDKYQVNEKSEDNSKTIEGPTKGQLRANQGPLNKEVKNNKKERSKELGVTPTPSGIVAEPSVSSVVWTKYSEAYLQVYGVWPIRNAKVNGQIAQVVARLGKDAPDVAEYYLKHRGNFYVAKMHPVGLLLSDAEKLHTEWKVGRQMTSTIANQADRSATLDQVFDDYLRSKKL